MKNSAHDPDLDPLIRQSRTKGIAINRREQRMIHAEKWGRIRLGIISICLFFVIYVCFAMSTWPEQRPQIIVNIPPNDESLPGPSGVYFILICLAVSNVYPHHKFEYYQHLINFVV